MRSEELLRPPIDNLTPLQPQLTGSSTHSSEGYISDDTPEAEEITDAHTIQLEAKPFALGGCSDVYRGSWKPSWSKTKLPVAVKVLRFSGMSKDGTQNYQMQIARIDRRLAREMFAWEKARHPNITPLLGFMRSTNSILLGDCPFLVMPYYRNGNMNTYLSKHPSADVLAMLRQAATGLKYLHSFKPRPIAHLDIKGENILINDTYEASICDFGVSRMVDELSTGFTTSNPILTVPYAPPEILEGEKGDTTSDAFSFGRLILRALSGKVPFYQWRKTYFKIIAAVVAGEQPPQKDYPIVRLSPAALEAAWALMRRCWSKERSARPTMEDILTSLENIASLNV